jgi:hypothetical protein
MPAHQRSNPRFPVFDLQKETTRDEQKLGQFRSAMALEFNYYLCQSTILVENTSIDPVKGPLNFIIPFCFFLSNF